MILNQEKSQLLIIDIQEKLLNAVFNKDSLLKKAVTFAKACKILEIPVTVTEQYPKGLGLTVDEIKNSLSSAKYFEKTAFSALEDLELVESLKNNNRKQIILFGIETHICVHQTACALLKQGYEVVLIKDACGSRSEEEYLSALEVLKASGVQIKTTEMALFELLKTSKHPNFKEIQSLIK